MQHQNKRYYSIRALTLVEMVIAMGIMAIIFAVVLPQFRVIQNSWDSTESASEALQNGRVLIDHLNRNLSQAVRVTAVSDLSDTRGYIEFESNDANDVRYDIDVNNYVEFGPIGHLSELAGPVNRLQFTCYGSIDLDTPITDVNAIRSVKVEATVINPAKLGHEMVFSIQAYLRTNALPAAGDAMSKMCEPWLEFDTAQGREPALARMSGTKSICTYRGDHDDGWACVLTANTGDWSVDVSGCLEYDTKRGVTPSIAKIDDSNFLCAYQGDKGRGWACILYEWPAGSGTLMAGPKLEFGTAGCIYPALSSIPTQGDPHRFLCAYFDNASSVRMVVLNATIIPPMQLTSGSTTLLTCGFVCQPALAAIDDTHYLCAYRGSNLRQWAVVLTVDTGNWTVSTETPFEVVPTLSAYGPRLARIDETHYLNAFTSDGGLGCAVVLTVHSGVWTITKDTAYDYYPFSDLAAGLELCQIDATNFLGAYRALDTGGGSTFVLTVNTNDWSLSKDTCLSFEPTSCLGPVLCQIDPGHYLCAYSGPDSDGFAGILRFSSGEILP